MTKNVYKQKYFSVVTKNSNWEILSKNLIKDEKLYYFGGSWKDTTFRGGFMKNQYRGGIA